VKGLARSDTTITYLLITTNVGKATTKKGESAKNPATKKE
jgi:hypothetical protein